MVIKDGYDSQPCRIFVTADSGADRAEVWIEMDDDQNSDNLPTEKLHYATILELIRLRNEINESIRTMAGV